MNRLKLLIASSIVAFLPGCALWDAYFMANYDNLEYGLTNKVRTLSELAIEDCKDPQASRENFEGIYFTTIELRNFTQYIPNNVDANKLANNLVELSKQGREMYAKSNSVSEAFCKLKLQQINRSAEMAQKVIGSKPR
jgi:hypothetical protein